MGKFTNLILLAAAAALILIGVAAQIGTVSFGNHSRHSRAVISQTAQQPSTPDQPYVDTAPPDTSQPADQNPQPEFTTEDSGHGHGHGHGNGGGGDKGD